MVGLSVLLESHEKGMYFNRTGKVVIKQTAAMQSTTKPASSFCSTGFVVGVDQFLHQCFLCKHKLLENKDIYMYMGEMAFCSEECRLEHMIKESNDNGVGQQLEEVEEEEESGGRSSQKKVKKKSLFSADMLERKDTRGQQMVGLHVECLKLQACQSLNLFV